LYRVYHPWCWYVYTHQICSCRIKMEGSPTRSCRFLKT
jgi:hypothetical protein